MRAFLLISVLVLLWSAIVVVIFLVLVLFLQLAIMLMSRQENKQRTYVNCSITGTAGFTG